MLYHLFYPLHEVYSAFNVFRYITFRAVYAIITAFLISLVFGPLLIRKLKEHHIGQEIREEGPKTHFSKAGTPTMGGLLILIALALPVLLWADLSNRYIWLILFSTLGFGAIGFWDDYLKVIKKHNLGLKGRYKLLAQTVVGLGVAFFLYYYPSNPEYATRLGVPFFKTVLPDLNGFYILFAVLLVVGASNAVNLTDGLDGLAIVPVIISMIAYMVMVYAAGHAGFASYLNIPYVTGVGELAIFCGAVIGAGLGFLWFNAYPAQMFMGDVGALALGGALGTLALVSKNELILLLIGGVFVAEALSVIIQVIYFKLTGGKRIFRMAPLHHHFEQLGWEEPKIIVRFWIVSIILALLSLSTLKLR